MKNVELCSKNTYVNESVWWILHLQNKFVFMNKISVSKLDVLNENKLKWHISITFCSQKPTGTFIVLFLMWF